MRRLLLATALGSAVALPVLAPGTALAQSAIEVVVRADGTGQPLAGLPVLLSNPETGLSLEAVTDRNGRVQFPSLRATGGYVVSVAGTPETAAVTTGDIDLRAQFTRSVTLSVPPAVVSDRPVEELRVVGQRNSTRLNLSNAEVSSTFTFQELVDLPVEARDLSTVLFRLPNVTPSTGFFGEAPAISINGTNGLFTQYLVDGLDNNENFLGGQKFPTPVTIVEAVTVLTNSYSAEFGRTANGIVNVTTKSGGNALAGEVFFITRPGNATDADNTFPSRDLSGNLVGEGFRRFQGGAALSGALVPDKTFFFASAETTHDDRDNFLASPVLGVDATIPGSSDFTYGTLRIDHNWSEKWSSALRFNRGQVALERQGGGLSGGVTFPSAGDRQTRVSTLAAFQTRYVGERLSYEGDLQYSRFSWNFGEPVTVGPQVAIRDPQLRTVAVIGNNGFQFDELERSWQTRQKLRFGIGDHRLSVGLDYLRSSFSLAGGGNPNGNFTVDLTDSQLAAIRARGVGADLTVADLPADARVSNFTFNVAPETFGETQHQLGVWIEDEVDITDRLTGRIGIRWDYDNLTSFGDGQADLDNVAPRASFNYQLTDSSVIRGGIGLFTEKFPYVLVSDALQRNTDTPAFRAQLQSLIAQGRLPADTDIDRLVNDGPANITVNVGSIAEGLAFIAGVTPGQESTLRTNAAPTEYQLFNPFGYENPRALQASLGYQQQLAAAWFVDVNLSYSRGRNLVRLVDLNAPAQTAPLAQLTAEQAAALTDAQLRALVRTTAEANALRPVAPVTGGATSLVVSDTGGRSEYKAANVTLTKEKGADFYGLRVSYTLSRSENDTDDINFRAFDSNDFDAERSVSLNDRTHAISSIFYLFPLPGMTVSVAGLFQSGQPINFGPDANIFGTTDLNGDGFSFATAFTGTTDRPPGVGRNSGRLPWSEVVDVGVGYEIPLGYGALELRADIFNVFNTNNLSGYTVNLSSSNQFQIADQPFAQRSAGPARQVQFGLRYLF